MVPVVYSISVSLDGFIAGPDAAEQTMSDEADLEFARIWRPIPKVVFSRILDSVSGNARLATDDIATEVARLRDQPGEGTVGIGGVDLATR
jgi:hypothetical protein